MAEVVQVFPEVLSLAFLVDLVVLFRLVPLHPVLSPYSPVFQELLVVLFHEVMAYLEGLMVLLSLYSSTFLLSSYLHLNLVVLFLPQSVLKVVFIQVVFLLLLFLLLHLL